MASRLVKNLRFKTLRGKTPRELLACTPGVLAAWAVPTKGLLWRGSFESPMPDNRANQEPTTSLDACCMGGAYERPSLGRFFREPYARQQSDQRRRRRRLARVKYQLWEALLTIHVPRGKWLETQAALPAAGARCCCVPPRLGHPAARWLT